MNAHVDATLAAIREDRSALVAELNAAGARWASNGRDCHCAFHADDNPSAGIFQTEDRVWRFKCFPCGLPAADLFDVRARRLNRQPADVLREWRLSQPAAGTARHDPERRHAKVYPDRESLRSGACYQGHNEPPLSVESEDEYTDPDSARIDLIVFRLRQVGGRKTFRQASPAVGGGWHLRGPEGRWPLFNRTRVRASVSVIVVEGEKCVRALTPVLSRLPQRWAATTNPGGGERGKAATCDWSPLAGKRVFLWPDNDPPDPRRGGARTGVEHMRAVAEALARLNPPAECWWIDPDRLGLPDHGDAADWVSAAGTGADPADRLDAEVLRFAARVRASAPLQTFYAEHAAGKRYAVPWPWPKLSRATHSLQPGLLTMVCGEAGAGKSFLIVESLWHWLHHGTRPACLMLESAAEFHAARLHAMLAERPSLLDPEWLCANGDESEALYQAFANDLDLFWSCLETVRKDDEVTPGKVLDWLKRQGKAGSRVMVVDPITAMADDQPWVTDVKFLRPVAQIAEDFGASVVMTIHPDRGGRRMARSEGVKRCVDSIFWLARHETPRQSRVCRGGVPMPTRHNRTVRITKARQAAGGGGELAYDFAGDRLRFAEIGVIVGGGPDIEQEALP